LTVGRHGFFKAFAPYGLGETWVMEKIAFKPYACGTMTQPYIDCAIALAERGVSPEDIEEISCDVGEGTVHRLWETLSVKHAPPTPHAVKFSTPFCMAIGFFDRRTGFGQFTEARIHDPAVLTLARKIHYRIDPVNEYLANFTGHLRATMHGGSVHELRQNFMRGGAHAPLTDEDLERKFFDNALYGGWNEVLAKRAGDWCRDAFEPDAPHTVAAFRA
jgi:2-methylcitrate dehydratase PrpD